MKDTTLIYLLVFTNILWFVAFTAYRKRSKELFKAGRKDLEEETRQFGGSKYGE